MTGIGCFSWRNRETARESKNGPEKNRKQHYLWAVPSETETSAPIVVSYAPSCLCGIIYPKRSLSLEEFLYMRQDPSHEMPA